MASEHRRQSGDAPRGRYSSAEPRRHSLSPRGRPRSAVADDRPRRPRYAAEDSYYDPLDKYYLSGDDDIGFKPTRRETVPYDSSEVRYRRNSPQPRRQSRDSKAGDRSHSTDGHHTSHHRRSRDDHSDSSSRRSSTAMPSNRRSSTAVSSSQSPSSRRYPPSASRAAGRGPGHGSGTKSVSQKPRSASAAPSSPNKAILGAARVAVEAGIYEAMKMRDDQSPWIGMKGTKVATAAVGAALVDTFLEHKHPSVKGGHRHAMVRTVTQVALSHLITKPVAKGHKMGREER